MRIAAGIRGTKRLQRLGLIAAFGVSALTFTGCSAINPQSTTMDVTLSDGVHQSVGDLDLRNVLVISEGHNTPGRVLGTFYNNAKSKVTLTISGNQGSQTEVTVEPGVPLVLNGTNDAAILSSVKAPAGAMEVLKLRAGSDTAEINVPVLDGTLAEYKGLVPTAVPTKR